MDDDEDEEMLDIKEEIYKDVSSITQASEIRQGKNNKLLFPLQLKFRLFILLCSNEY